MSDTPNNPVTDDTAAIEDFVKNEGNDGSNENGEQWKEEADKDQVFDEDSDNPPAGTPGHPGIDEGTA